MDLWLGDDLDTGWTHPERVHDGTGSSQHYTDQAMLTCRTLRVSLKMDRRSYDLIDPVRGKPRPLGRGRIARIA